MQRTIDGFHRDEVGDWVAELSCLHGQHVRHRPPFRDAPWVDDDAERSARVGTAIDCPLCDRAELPEGLRVARTTATFTDATAPAALQRDHRVAARTWGLLVVSDGRLRFVAETSPRIDRVVTPDEPQPIPPEVAHHVGLTEPVRFTITFLTR
jgi:tellurite methyltransferase